MQPNPKKEFTKNLQTLITKLKSNKHSIILCGDFNETIEDERSGLSKLCSKQENQLVDIISHRHSNSVMPNTYLHGKKRLDYLLITSDLVPAVVRCGYEPFLYRQHTDH